MDAGTGLTIIGSVFSLAVVVAGSYTSWRIGKKQAEVQWLSLRGSDYCSNEAGV